MRVAVRHENYGTIVYEESIWTGSKKTLYLKGVNFQKIDKKTFEGVVEDRLLTATVEGNVLKGVVLTINGESIQLIQKPAWYVLVFSILIFAFNFSWGNSAALCAIFPIVGGGIGGGISGLFAISNVFWASKTKNVGLKILIGVGCFVGMIAVCFLLAVLIVSLAYGM